MASSQPDTSNKKTSFWSMLGNSCQQRMEIAAKKNTTINLKTRSLVAICIGLTSGGEYFDKLPSSFCQPRQIESPARACSLIVTIGIFFDKIWQKDHGI